MIIDISGLNERRHIVITTIRVYLIRRRMLGLTQGENKNIVLLCSRIEEIALNNGWLSNQQVLEIGQSMSKNDYGQYLISLVGEGL